MSSTLRPRPLAMDSTSMNHYEQQLYTVFKTFDVDNSEALDRSSVLELCQSLQLEERGATLVDTLFDRRSERVTFAQFRNGLLSVLGAPRPPSPPVQTLSAAQIPIANSDDDSSGREVAPKFVFGSKKYGRRSRPQRSTPNEQPAPRASSESRLDANGRRTRQRMKCKRSSSVMENRDQFGFTDDDIITTEDLDHDRRINCTQAIALCRSLHMDGIDRRLVEHIFENTSTDETTIGEFFNHLNASLTTSIATCDGGARDGIEDGSDDETNGIVPNELIIEEWERVGVQCPRQLLTELGFTNTALRASELERALDDELTALASPLGESCDARSVILAATLALARLRLRRARSRADVAVAERDKFRTDLAEANRRAQMLAQDVDENHARIEAELKANLQQVETRHAETMRAATAEWTAERERAVTLRSQLEDEIARRTETETRLRLDADALREHNEELARRITSLEERVAEAERENTRVRKEAEEAAGSDGDMLNVEKTVAGELAVHLDELRLENKMLRDRNDELCAELEASARRSAATAGGAAAVGASWRDEAAEATRGDRSTRTRGSDCSADTMSLLAHDRTEDCDSSLVSLDQKVIGHIEAVQRLLTIFESVQSLLPSTNKICESCDNLKGAIASIQDKVQELSESVILADQTRVRLVSSAEVGVQTEILSTTKDVLCSELATVEARHREEREKLSESIKDLEASLEQMKIEYDKCEEYWSCKLEDERDAYAEEQRTSDERLAELVAKIGEYERQFTPRAPPALPPIQEVHSLETQFTDLEEEFAEYKKRTDSDLEVKREEITRLKERIETLERRGGDSEASSPIGYLWSQGTVQVPQRRDYHNPAYAPRAEAVALKSASDGEREPERAPLNPIRRPSSAASGVQRSASAGAVPAAAAAAAAAAPADDRPVMLNCAELEGQLRRQAQQQMHAGGACGGCGGGCAAAGAWARWRAAEARAAREGAALRARAAHAESLASRLRARLAAADLLVKDLYLENCHLAHQRLL